MITSKIKNKKITLGFSPCPNDTFIFDAMVHEKIDTEGLSFEYFLSDIERLNLRAFQKDFDVTKLSYFAYAFVSEKYQLLQSGSALGYKCGPLLISKIEIDPAEIHKCSIAIPGEYTTAHFLFSIAFPGTKNKKELFFPDIENAILNDEVDAGLIIHENRFTYQQKGLIKLIDFGEYWEEQTKLPIPLGGIAIKRSIPDDIKSKVNRVIKRSIEYAFANTLSGYDFIKANAQGLNDDVLYKHIELYVNKFSLELGEEGRNAVEMMYKKALEKKIIPVMHDIIFS